MQWFVGALNDFRGAIITANSFDQFFIRFAGTFRNEDVACSAQIPKSTGESNEELIKRIRRYNRTAEIIECAHKPLHLKNVVTGEIEPLEKLRGTYIGSLCAIAAPASFEDGLRKLGAQIEIAKRYIDHHRYSEAERQSFISRGIRRDLEMVVTTEKDAVRFPLLTKTEVPIFFLRVEIEILSGHETWEHCVARICKPQPLLTPERFFA